MNMRVLLLICSLFIFGKTNSTAAPDNVPDFGRMTYDFKNLNSRQHREIIRKLDSFYAVEVSKGFNGSVLIGYRGKIMYERYFGYANRAKGIKWSSKTRSQLASTSKTFTSAAVLALSDKGLIDVNDKVQQYIPEFPYRSITVKMLLNHRSGLRDYVYAKHAKPRNGKYFDNQDVIDWLVRVQPKQHFNTNTNFKYSNTNFAVLASVVERVSGMRFKYFVERFVFKKLGMNNTEIHDPNLLAPYNVALSYKSGRHYKDMYQDGVYGDKGVYSSVRDLYKWDQALYSNKLLKWTTLKTAFKPYSFEKRSQRNYGLGWRMIHYPTENMKVVYHNGLWHGNNTCFYRFVNDNFTIIVLGNNYTSRIYKQPAKIFRLIAPKEKPVLYEDQG